MPQQPLLERPDHVLDDGSLLTGLLRSWIASAAERASEVFTRHGTTTS